MFKFIISCLYFFLPAYFTNMTPPLAKKFGIFDFLDKPVDFNKTFNDKPVLGSHKTWRGVVAGVLVGTIAAYAQTWLYQFSFFRGLSFFNYQKINIPALAFIMCVGAILGDLLFAFIKRRSELAPGTKFVPWDQINYVIGAFVLFSLTSYFEIDNLVWITLVIMTFFLHIIINRIGYYMNLHKAEW